MARTSVFASLTCASVLLVGCSGTSSSTTTSSTSPAARSTTTASPASVSTTAQGENTSGDAAAAGQTPLAARTPASASSATGATPVALPAGHRWLPVDALHTRAAIPSDWVVVGMSTLRDQTGTPAFDRTARRLGMEPADLADFVSSGAVAFAVGTGDGDSTPNLLVRTLGGPAFSSGDQLTAGARGATGVLDAQSRPTTPAGPAVRGDFHVDVDGSPVHAAMLGVTVDGQQDIITVSAEDESVVKKVMDVIARTYSRTA